MVHALFEKSRAVRTAARFRRVIDDSEPACDRHLNVPEGEPRLRLLRGGVWW
jgi:hypothetical protein